MAPSKKSFLPSLIRITAIVWLVFILSFSLGVYVYSAKKWPYPVVEDIEKFIKGHSEEKTTLIDKIKNDLGAKPTRHIVYPQTQYPTPAH